MVFSVCLWVVNSPVSRIYIEHHDGFELVGVVVVVAAVVLVGWLSLDFVFEVCRLRSCRRRVVPI